MKIFGNKIKEGHFYKEIKEAKIRYKIEKILSGYIITGKIKGNLKEIEVLKIERPHRKLYLNNWQSWGLFLKENEYKKIVDEYKKRRIGIYTYTPIPELFKKETISDYFVSGSNLFIGFLTSKVGHPYFIIKDDSIHAQIEYFDTEFKDYIELEPLIILEKLPMDISLFHYATLVKLENKVKISKWNPIGWSSWYQYFLDLKWERILEDLKISRKKRMPYEVFQIDDGYEKDIGDWLSPKEGFPKLLEMAKIIKDYGYIPGIWTAPLSVSETSQIYNMKKDWVITENGIPKKGYYNWEKDIYVLDITNNNVKNWIYKLFSDLKKIGFRYFKVDFMFAGAIPGSRRKKITPIQAYREALSVIKEGIGNDSFILGCGAPLLPSVGMIDGMRIGPDTAPIWDNSTSQPDINAYWALKGAITRWFMHRNWWLNDPDCLILRNKENSLILKQKELYSIISGMLDNIIFESDAPSYIGERERDLLDMAISYRGGKAKVKFMDDDSFIISTEGSKKGNTKILVNLSKSLTTYNSNNIRPFSYTILEKDKNGIELSKKVIKREDGRMFIYYEGKN